MGRWNGRTAFVSLILILWRVGSFGLVMALRSVYSLEDKKKTHDSVISKRYPVFANIHPGITPYP